MGLMGVARSSEDLAPFEPLVLVPTDDSDMQVGLIVVVVDRPEKISAVTAAVSSVLGARDSTKVTVQTSETVASLHAIIQGQLGAFSRGLLLTTLGVMGLLIAVLQTGLVMMRRRDFGRRRALGATRGLVVLLVLFQTALLAAAGAVIGLAGSVLALIVGGDPLPGIDFMTAVVVLVLTVTVVASLIPATVASARDPLKELRVP